VVLAPDVAAADIVTLDKVVCCYRDMPALLAPAAERARRVVGLVSPRDVWWNRLASRLFAAWGRLTRDHTRWTLHRPADIDAVLARAGFDRHDVRRELIWQVSIYRRRHAEQVTAPTTS